MFVLDSADEILLTTSSFDEWFDSTADRLTGRDFSTLVADGAVAELQEALETVRTDAGPRSERIGCRIRSAGETVPVEIELTSLREDDHDDGVIGTVRSQPGSQSRLRQPSATDWFDYFFETMDEAVVKFELTERGPIVQAVNPAFERTFGYHAGYVVGDPLNEYIVPESNVGEATDFDERVAAGEMVESTVTRVTTSGPREFRFRCFPVDSEGPIQSGLAIYSDVTEEQQSKDHLHVLHRVLRHNLSNELTVILGMAQAIDAESDAESIRGAATRITEAAERLEGVTEKARSAQKILGHPPSDTVVDVGETATTVASAARSKWPSAAISTEITTPLPVATGVEVRDALDNLVENAVRHNDDDPTVHVTARRETPIHISTREFGQQAVITVEDDGPGIPEPELATVFEQQEITQLNHASGLGLWVARWIIESAGGSINYTRDDGWTTITLRLPLAGQSPGQTAAVRQ